jgi:hypothetical protein
MRTQLLNAPIRLPRWAWPVGCIPEKTRFFSVNSDPRDKENAASFGGDVRQVLVVR